MSGVPTLVLQKANSQRIFYVSFLTIISIVTSYLLRLYDFTIVTSLIFMSSVNYWRSPVYGIRRNTDVILTMCGCTYQLYQSIHSVYHIQYMLCVALAALCYAKAKITIDQTKSSLWHCGIHLFGNVGNIVLYIGMSS